jgi:hypothetical protein
MRVLALGLKYCILPLHDERHKKINLPRKIHVGSKNLGGKKMRKASEA